jgi:YbbR domain-containing protein
MSRRLRASVRIRQLLLDHFWWKLFSLVLAFLLWLAVAEQPELTTTLGVPVEYKNVPKDLDISTDVPEKVMLQLRGPRDKTTAAATNLRLAAVLDVGEGQTSVRPGDRTFTIGAANVQLPAGISLIRAVPGQIRLALEHRLQKDVTVSLRYSGAPPPGFRVKIGEVTPERIQVVGPESRVRAVETVETDPIDLRTLEPRADRAAEVMLNTYLADGHVSPVGPSTVRARILLEKVE